MRKSDEIFRFLDAPPSWFAMLVWMFPLFYSIFYLFMSVLIHNTVAGSTIYVLLFPTLLVLLFCSSRWFRARIIFMVTFWLFFMISGSGITQGSLESAISRAFSSVNSQLENLSEADERARSFVRGSSKSLDRRP